MENKKKDRRVARIAMKRQQNIFKRGISDAVNAVNAVNEQSRVTFVCNADQSFRARVNGLRDQCLEAFAKEVEAVDNKIVWDYSQELREMMQSVIQFAEYCTTAKQQICLTRD